jgi:hypothetical protein
LNPGEKTIFIFRGQKNIFNWANGKTENILPGLDFKHIKSSASCKFLVAKPLRVEMSDEVIMKNIFYNCLSFFVIVGCIFWIYRGIHSTQCESLVSNVVLGILEGLLCRLGGKYLALLVPISLAGLLLFDLASKIKSRFNKL